MGHDHDGPEPVNDDATAADERTVQGVEHLQAAAHEMIEAARAFLDVMEDLVRDDEKVASVAEAFGSIARGARAARSASGGAGTPGTGDDGGSDDRGFDGGVQHIRVS